MSHTASHNEERDSHFALTVYVNTVLTKN